MKKILELAETNMRRAREIIEDARIEEAWKSIGARVNLIGSVKMGLLMTHRDIDFHIYSSSLDISASFSVMAQIAENPRIQRVEYKNLADTEEQCLEWHAWYLDRDQELWRLDMIHVLAGSKYDGHMENVAERIVQVLTPELKQTILRIKYDTPDNVKVMGIEYYQAVIRDGVKDYDGFVEWRKNHPADGVMEWMP